MNYDHLPPFSNRPSTELGYALASRAIDMLFAHKLISVTKRPHPSSVSLRTMLEAVCKPTYIGKGDVYTALTDKGFVLKPDRNGTCTHYAASFNIKLAPEIWDVFVNRFCNYASKKVMENYRKFATEWISESAKIKQQGKIV